MHRSLSLLILLSLYSFTLAQNYVYHFINEPKSWSDAQAYCKQNYTDLATVYNMEDVRRLNETTNGTDAWIGLYQTSDKKENRTWHWSHPGLEYCESQANWKAHDAPNAHNEPNDGGYTSTHLENCLFIDKTLKWLDGLCSELLCFICYNESSNIYELTGKKKWSEALQDCRENHGDLISGLHQLNDSALQTILNSSNYCEWWWIGLFRDTWGWSDGSNSSFRPWGEWNDILAPSNSQRNTDDKCVKLGNQRKLVGNECGTKNAFICYDNHYILVNKNLSWEDALYYCRKHYRDLAWITNKHETRMVQERAKMANSDFVWLGLHYTCFLEEWVWVNGHNVSNGTWKYPKPNDCGVSGAMEKGGENQWVKMPSEKMFNFVCAKHC